MRGASLHACKHFMQKLFVTGGAGFIGSAFIRQALARWPDAEIINFDALTYAGNPDNLSGLDERRHRFVRGDIADQAAVRAALSEGTDAVFNFAAESHVDRSTSARRFLRTNLLASHVILTRTRTRRASFHSYLDRRVWVCRNTKRVFKEIAICAEQSLRRPRRRRPNTWCRRAPQPSDSPRSRAACGNTTAAPVSRKLSRSPVKALTHLSRLWRRAKRPRLDLRRRPLPRHHARLRTRRSGRHL